MWSFRVTETGAVIPIDSRSGSLDALERALNFIRTNHLNTAEYEMISPDSVQRISSQATSGWRVSWRHRIPAGPAAIKGGQLVIFVHDSGTIEQGTSE